MHDVVASLPLAEDIREALVQRRGRMGQLLDCVVALETGEDDPVLSTIRRAGEVYLEALMWANSAAESLFGEPGAAPARAGQAQGQTSASAAAAVSFPRRAPAIPSAASTAPAESPAAIPSVAVPPRPRPVPPHMDPVPGAVRASRQRSAQLSDRRPSRPRRLCGLIPPAWLDASELRIGLGCMRLSTEPGPRRGARPRTRSRPRSRPASPCSTPRTHTAVMTPTSATTSGCWRGR